MSERYWDPQLETLPVERRRLLRDHRLRWQVRRCWDGSPFYRARLEATGLDPDTFDGLADLQRIPILRRGDLPSPDGASGASTEWTVAPEDWWQSQCQTDVGWIRTVTDGDALHQADLAARALWAAGARRERTLAEAVSAGDDWTRGAITAGARRIGVTLTASSDGRPSISWSTTWPPQGGDLKSVAGALSVPTVAPTLAYTCREAEGIHWADDHYLVEIVDPASHEPVEPGTAGAVVVTELAREGSPLLRFWTGLEAALIAEPCPCGRTSARSPFVRPLA